MQEIYAEQRVGKGCFVGRGCIPLHGRGLCPSPENNANYIQKRLNLVHIFVYYCYFLTAARWRDTLPYRKVDVPPLMIELCIINRRSFPRQWNSCANLLIGNSRGMCDNR